MDPLLVDAAAALHRVGLAEIQRRWGWFLGLGIVLVVLGTMAVAFSTLMTLTTMVLIGWLMIAGGVIEAFHAFRCRQWSGFFIDLLAGILYVVVGFMIVANPDTTAAALTLLIAVFLVFGGIFRIVLAISVRYQNSLWILLHGFINLILGIAIWRQWPLSGMWIIGLFIGIEMIFNGWSLVMLGMAAKRWPTT